MPMHNPAHPGEVLLDYLGEADVTSLAQRLKVARTTLSRILNGHAGISASMATSAERSVDEYESRVLAAHADELRSMASAQGNETATEKSCPVSPDRRLGLGAGDLPFVPLRSSSIEDPQVRRLSSVVMRRMGGE